MSHADIYSIPKDALLKLIHESENEVHFHLELRSELTPYLIAVSDKAVVSGKGGLITPTAVFPIRKIDGEGVVATTLAASTEAVFPIRKIDSTLGIAPGATTLAVFPIRK